MANAPDLNDALARLEAFRLVRNIDGPINEGSGRTADDIDTIVSFLLGTPSSD